MRADPDASSGEARRPVAVLLARATLLAYPELLPELSRCLDERGYSTLLRVLDREAEADLGLAAVSRDPIAGVIAGARPSERAIMRAQAARLPLLLYNCHAQGPTVASVSCDHHACGNTLAAMLLEGGHRRFGIIASPRDSLVGIERVAGAVAALERGNILALEVVEGDYSYVSGADALDQLFVRMKPKPSAIIAANDAMAIGALDRARALRARIPRDLSIVGIDGTQIAGLPSYELTTMRQPLRRLAGTAVEVLARVIGDPGTAPEIRLLGGELVPGKTARFTRPRRKVAHVAYAPAETRRSI